jgi:hypothetical protein
VVCLLISACAGTPVKRSLSTDESATLAGGRPLVIQHSAADERTLFYVWQQQGQFVRIEAAEPGAEPNQHPLNITKDQIKDALQQIRVGTAEGVPFLSDEALERIAGPLAQALGQTSADQDVSFAVAYRPPGFGRFMSRRVTTGRLFHDTSGLNLIVGLLHTPFEDKLLATGHRIAFTPGSRQHRIQEGWSLWAEKPVTHPLDSRDDWLLMAPKAKSGSVLDNGTANTPQQTTTPTGTDHTDRYRNLEQRLEVLKKLRDKGLISEEAYQLKSQQILEDL